MSMNEKACISVILPFYNNRHTIERAMSSVLAQSYPNWELIVVDDGSDDGGWALVEKIKDPRVRCYRLPHRNANVARNYGIARSHGVYIAMLDADDEWTEDHLTCSLEVLRKAEADGVYGSVILREKNDCLVVTRALQQNESWIDFLLSNGCAAQTSTLFMTSESVKAILWDESLLWHQDYDFMVRYCRKYRMCPKIEATTIYYRSQASKSVDFDSCIRFIKSVENEISLPVYRNYHLQMLHLAVACSADETIVRHYREITARFELQQIANHLIINSSFLTDLSLYHGKMGIVLFFYSYARYTGNTVYEEFAGELLDEIFEEIHDRIGVDFENGLSGIGWGILYLLQNEYIDGNPDDILEDIDCKIMEVNLLKVRDCSLERGVAGLSAYVSYRFSLQEKVSSFDTDFISDWYKVTKERVIDDFPGLPTLLDQCTCSSLEEIGITSLGLHHGYAGHGLKWMME